MVATKKIKLTKAARTRGAGYEPGPERSKVERRRPGAPSKYDERVAIVTACVAARHGATDEEIAAELGIAVSTLYAWYGANIEFSEAVKAAKAVADDRMERRLYSRGIGYQHEVEKVFANGNRITVSEAVLPDTTAQIFWLKNRKRMDWRDTREVDLVVPQDGEAEDQTDIRTLALAVINLLGDAAASPDQVGRTTIDLEPNSNEESDYVDGNLAAEAAQDGEAGAEDVDPDFDF